MAFVGEIYLGGFEPKITDGICSSAVAFNLKTPSSINEIYNKENWQIELKAGKQSVIARSHQILSTDEIIRIGFKLCEELLDLISIRIKGDLLIDKPGDNYIVLFKNNDGFVIQHIDFIDFTIGIESSHHSIDKNGNVISHDNQIEVDWHPAFRYYRLSQASSHLFEAYRNLFLAFEALLQTICPIQKKESAKKWIGRALSSTGGLCGTLDQYVDIRNKLFHAKSLEDISLYNDLNPEIVSQAYKGLIGMWHQLVSNLFKIKSSGGIITYEGFKLMMSNLRNNLKLYLSDDPTPPSKNDEKISPLNLNVSKFPSTDYIDDCVPGRGSFLGKMEHDELKRIAKIFRISSTLNDKLFAISFIKDGLIPSGIDKFETAMNIRLLNKREPKVTF